MWFLSCLLSLLTPAAEEHTLSFSLAGTVKEVLVKPGDTVKTDQKLVQLKDDIALSVVKIRQLMYKNQQHEPVVRTSRDFDTWMSFLEALKKPPENHEKIRENEVFSEPLSA